MVAEHPAFQSFDVYVRSVEPCLAVAGIEVHRRQPFGPSLPEHLCRPHLQICGRDRKRGGQKGRAIRIGCRPSPHAVCRDCRRHLVGLEIPSETALPVSLTRCILLPPNGWFRAWTAPDFLIRSSCSSTRHFSRTKRLSMRIRPACFVSKFQRKPVAPSSCNFCA